MSEWIKKLVKYKTTKKTTLVFVYFYQVIISREKCVLKKQDIWGGGDKRKQNTKWGWRLRRYTHRYDNNYSLWERGRKREIKGNELTGSVMC